ncbi:MAG: bifunctional riboflavin kinase/FAD synthetase [Gammaproteobacteria bacterium]|jgi:riboflavin kinase / FMN adenylyltransferase|nr:bifunctional riboflavin kinase/FAD synthetase [Gammaproteobacteria bacterium]MBT5686832.1 bifunctional riboflavin kinase/FAD synthetase [Gammaproteobacteria bacterium]MBT6584622.1 bifunctional riboflavin kinase/FAD synthetase [Gammaproteobacteria bacterium]MBT7879504.1 bifunctional riboflavin kinase/FAD synthetase [Gammaproteobacteria bacterium]
MEVIRGLLNVREKHRGAIVTIGNFDGVHKGHQSILKEVRDRADKLNVPAMLICFEPQPKEFFDLYDAPARLTRFREKVDLLSDLGIDYVYCVKFDEKARTMSAEEFVRILIEEIGISGLFVGDDFHFGFDRSGDFKYLQDVGKSHHFDVINMYTISHDNERVSSTRIRESLAQGHFELAEGLLGYAYSISGKVIYGRQIGRTLGVPTANIQLNRYVAPITGVFAVEMLFDGQAFPGVANVGVRPTIDDHTLKPILEVHLFDFSDDIYGKRAKVVFRQKIRDEKKFAGIEALKEAIMSDIKDAKVFFGGA